MKELFFKLKITKSILNRRLQHSDVFRKIIPAKTGKTDLKEDNKVIANK